MRCISFTIPCLLFVVAAVPAFAGEVVLPPTILTVGSGAGCDHSSVQDAIDAAPANGSTVIRISNNVAHNGQHLSISDRNIELRGGYPGCGLAPADPDARTTLRGNGGDSVILIDAAGQDRTVILRNLVIREGGSSDLLTERGGGVRVEGRSRVEIRNSLVGDNESHLGAGIFVGGNDASLVLDDGTIVGLTGSLAGNRALANAPAPGRGGGIYCDGADVFILDARLRGNSADQDGGGIYADACVMIITPRPAFVEGPGDEPGFDGFATFFENIAARNGGAIAAEDGRVEWRSAESGHFAGRANGNSAGNSGGTLHLSGTAHQFLSQWARIEASRAPNTGAAVHVANDAAFSFLGAPGMSCNYHRCPAIVDSNDGSGYLTATGGAVYASSGATVVIAQSLLSGNLAFAGSAVLAITEGTHVTLRHVLLHRNFLTGVNNTDSPVSIAVGADADLYHVTMAVNLRPGGVLLQPALSSVLSSGVAASVDIYNSILAEDGDVAVRAMNGGAATASCVLSHEDDSVDGLVLGDPEYLDPLGETPNFTPDYGSIAIDRCAVAETFPLIPLPDMHGRMRPFDVGGLDDGDGEWDMGALEASFLVTADIFDSGFEDDDLLPPFGLD